MYRRNSPCAGVNEVREKLISKGNIHRKHSSHTRRTSSACATSSIPRGIHVEPVLWEGTPASFSFFLGMEKGRMKLKVCVHDTSSGTGLLLWTDRMWLRERVQRLMQVCCSSFAVRCTVQLWGRLQPRQTVHSCVTIMITNPLTLRGDAALLNAAPDVPTPDGHGQGLGSWQSPSLSTPPFSFSSCPFFFHFQHSCVGDYSQNCLLVMVSAIKSINRCGRLQ